METKNQLLTHSNKRSDGDFGQKLISDLIKLVMRPSGDFARKKLVLFIEREEYSEDMVPYPPLLV